MTATEEDFGEGVESMMTAEQRARIGETTASQVMEIQGGLLFSIDATPFQKTGHFHTRMQMTTPNLPICPSVSVRERRLRLILEEYLELCEAMGFDLEIDGVPFRQGHERIGVTHIEQSKYDVVETADALGDLNVVVNGTGVEFGIPMHFIDHEVYCSNMTKLGINGKPIVNHCEMCGPNPDNVYLSTCECKGEDALPDHSNWLKPDAPLGKILKPEGFTSPNVPAILKQYEDGYRRVKKG